MTEYDIKYFDNKHISRTYTLVAKDLPHAITQFKELMPGMHMQSIYPSEQWTDDWVSIWRATQAHVRREYVDYFDPTPEYLYDEPYRMADYEEWKEDYLWEIDETNG